MNQETQDILKDLETRLKKAEDSMQQLEAANTQRQTQQLQYPLDFVSQQIIAGFTASPGASYFPMGGSKGFGLYYGTGSPSTVVTAAQGSLYLRYDGSSTSTRAYINTDGVTAWTAVTTAT